jgi:ketosteroid isomerase-like protein
MIRRILALLATVAALVPVAPTPARAAGAVEREIARLEQVCNDAYGRNDLEVYFGCYRDNAVLIFYDYRTTLPEYHKSWVESVRAGNVVASFKLSDLVVRVSPAGDVAVASFSAEVANHYADGHDTREKGFETDVWVRRDGRWKLEHVQYSLAAPPPA